MKKQSRRFTLNLTDFQKGIVMAFIGAILSGVYDVLSSDTGEFNRHTLIVIAKGAGIVVVSYLMKNFSTNSKGNILPSKEKSDTDTPLK